jgi:D-alanine--poly(phosphoribitol) ligase subunit 1
MGYRIELEEIEAGLNSLAEVREAAVVYRSEHGPAGRILAYVAADETVTQREILSALSEVLPPYMLPKKVKIMEQLPKNRNGKIDRVSLKELA